MPKKEMTNWETRWNKINGNVGLHFECPNCDNDFLIGPKSLVKNGTPTCTNCDVDMQYSGTYVEKE